MAIADLIALAERLQGVCLGRGLTVGLAESCTGGLVGHAITAVPGSSAYFVGSLVTYSDAAKQSLLAVRSETLAAHGAVSAQVAMAMATGALTTLGTDLAAAVTGIAGPDGGSRNKPVGLTYIAVAGPAGTTVERHEYGGDRTTNKDAAATSVLEALIAVVEAGP